MKKVFGIAGLLMAVVAITTYYNPQFVSAYNVENTLRWSALFGIISVGVAFVIITGGIDLSIGSVVGVTGCLLPMFIVPQVATGSGQGGFGWPVWLSVLIVLAISVGIGLLHGLLITKMRLQPFVVTLCGLLFYRGIARYMTGDSTQGFGAASWAVRNSSTLAFSVLLSRCDTNACHLTTAWHSRRLRSYLLSTPLLWWRVLGV